MKICPKCNQTYTDENLNFCLEDGNALIEAGIDDQETVVIDHSAETEVHRPFETEKTWENPKETQQSSQPIYTPQINSNQASSGANNYNTAPVSNSGGGSKTWIWAIVALISIVLLCGSGTLIGLAVIGSYAEEEKDEPIAKTQPSPSINQPEKDSSLIKSTDFSKMNFKSNEYITVDNGYDGLELITRKNYFYVFAFDGFPTSNARTKITVTNKNAEATTFGYGLVVQSDPKNILSKDYAFVIRSDKRQYRVVKHKNLKESIVHNWRTSSAINRGSEPNDLEVRISGNQMKFYINDKFVKTVTDTNRYDGVAGVYTGDDVPITFSNLEIRKNN